MRSGFADLTRRPFRGFAGVPCLLFFFMPIFGDGQLAGQSLLDRPARLSVRDVALEEAIRALQRSSGVSLAFSPDLLPQGDGISCSCESVSVGEALRTLLAGTGLIYLEGRRQVIIGLGGGGEENGDSPSAPVHGRVVEGGSDFPVAGAVVSLEYRRGVREGEGSNGSGRNGMVTGTADSSGRFNLPSVPPGEYHLRARAPGFMEGEGRAVRIPFREQDLRLSLFRLPIPLEAIVISPGSFGILEGSPAAMGTRMSRKEIESIPQFGDDAFRAVQRMPGVASGDINTQLNVRGSTGRDLLVRLDGLELYEPFHLRDADGVFGIVDIQALGEITLVTGGFGPEYGDRYGALFDMRTRTPPVQGARTTLSASLSSLSATSQGTFSQGRGAWLSAARWGFLDLVFDITDYGGGFSPAYWDALGRVEYRLSPRHEVSAHLLLAGDNLDWSEDRTGSALLSEWTNRYLWGQWGATFRPGLRANTLLAMGEFRRDRGGQMWRARGGDYSPMMGWVSDEGDFSFRQLRQEWQLDLRESLLLKFGYDLRDSDGAYDYHGRATFPEIPPEGGIVQVLDSTVVDLGVEARSVGGWGALRGRLGTAFTGELGLRFDHQSHTGDSDLAPRISLRWDPRPDVTFKGSWGRYFQSQRVYELRVGDGEMDFSPSEHAEQVALGIEGRTAEGLSWRLEGYTRTLQSPHPEFVSLARQVVPFPELQTDRVRVKPSRGRGRGIEVIFSKEGSGPLSWSGSYALAQAESKVEGEWVPRTLDQRHTLNVHVAYRFNRWRISGAYQFHTGWPVTEQKAEPELVGGDSNPWEHLVRREFGPLNAERLPDYARVDLRISRFFEFGRSRLELFLDIFNLTNEENIRGYEYFLDYPWPYPSSTVRGPGDELLPILPTLGFRWVF